MITIIFIAGVMFVCAFMVKAQIDTMYVMKDGNIIHKQSIKSADVDSVIFYKPESTSGTFKYSRDGNVYKWVKIGNQVWMAENLKYLPSIVGSMWLVLFILNAPDR